MSKLKKVEVVIESTKQEDKTLWQKIKDWFWHSESIALSYIVTIGGAITTFVGSLDFSPLWSLFQTGTDFTSKQLTWIGASILGTGLSIYIARVRGTKDVEGRLLPKAS